MCPRGYTLVELLVVMAVMGVLASLAMPMAEMTVQREKERELKRALWEIRDAIDAYHNARVQGAIAGAGGLSLYPPTLNALAQPYVDVRSGRGGATLRFLRRVPRDPFADPALPADQTWALRSYLSSAENPQSGDDVYDVFSRATTSGLNGVPLRQW